MGQLDAKVALVTGGAKSIGLEFAGALAAEGASVAIADIADGTAAATNLAEDHGVDARSYVTDVSSEEAVKSLVDQVIADFGQVDILINNAARFAELALLPLEEISADLWDSVMAVNVRGPFLMVKHVSPHMKKAGVGKIINIGSGTANKGMPNMLAYVTSKSALLGFTRSLSRELGSHGICVNTLSPGLIESPSVRENPHHLSLSEKVLASRALKRSATPSDLLGALVFLAGPASDFVTGQTIAVDGGSVNT